MDWKTLLKVVATVILGLLVMVCIIYTGFLAMQKAAQQNSLTITQKLSKTGPLGIEYVNGPIKIQVGNGCARFQFKDSGSNSDVTLILSANEKTTYSLEVGK